MPEAMPLSPELARALVTASNAWGNRLVECVEPPPLMNGRLTAAEISPAW